jgi:hypothetical protein
MGFNQQFALLQGVREPGTGVGYSIDHIGGYPKGTTTLAVAGGTGTILDGDTIFIGFGTYPVKSGLSGGNITLSIGLKYPVADGEPIAIDTSPENWTDTNEAAEALNRLYTQIRVNMKPLSGTEALETTFNITTSSLMVPRMIDLEAV